VGVTTFFGGTNALSFHLKSKPLFIKIFDFGEVKIKFNK